MGGLFSLRKALGTRTTAYPAEPAELPEGFRGRLEVKPDLCVEGCRACADACPTEAIGLASGLSLDLGRCVFCTACTDACPEGALRSTSDHRLAASRRADLVLSGGEARLAAAASEEIRRVLGRSLRLRQVSAGGCSGCEAELIAAGNVVFDLSRFGIQFVASPRHADGLVVTGVVSRNMRAALLATYEAVPPPKIVVAVGACAISGGVFRGSPEVHDGVEDVLPVDLYVAGCPPHPLTILDGLLRLLGRLDPRGDAPPRTTPLAP